MTQLQMFTTEYEAARFARDLAAYGVVGVLESAIYWAKQGDTKHVAAILERAKAKYEAADLKLRTLEAPEQKQQSRVESAA